MQNQSKGGQLHQVIAVESDLRKKFKDIKEETIKVFTKKLNLFQGQIRKYIPFDETEKILDPEKQEITTTVMDKIFYVSKSASTYFDAIFQKEEANQRAFSDLEVDGKIIAEKVPATFLLGMEKRLESLKEVFLKIPTLDTSVEWIPSNLGENILQTKKPEQRFKTRKAFRSQILVQPTEHHPAQVEKWEENETVGIYETTKFSGEIHPKEKSEMLERIDKLIIACKKARQRANNVATEHFDISSKIFNYIINNGS